MEARKKILIVDDEQINLEFFDVMLSKLGFLVEKAENGLEALEKIKQFNPDLIILDNIMPKMSGWEVTKTLKSDSAYEEFKEIPIIMFSAMDDVKDKVEGFELGVDDYITKPYNFSEVLARIKAVLRNRELFAQIAARESRVNFAESLNDEVYTIINVALDVSDRMRDKLKALSPQDLKEFETIRAEADELRAKLAHAYERLKQAEKQREALKNKEIELHTLQRQYRKTV